MCEKDSIEDIDSIYDELGVQTVINGVGTRTQVSGARLREGVAEAMERASEKHVYMAELQARASERIAEATGADKAIVTPGAAAAMLIGSAACIAGNDFETMAQLPDTEGVASEVVIPKAHRIKYDVALRASGADLVDVGHVSHHPVEGGVDHVEPWQLEAAIGEDTAAVAYVQRPHNILELETVINIAHQNDVPVLVDAASEVPPPQNLERFIETGADLVAYSGGKGLGGPQPTGFLVGRKDLISSAAALQVPDGYYDDIWNPPSTLIERDQFPEGTPAETIGRPLKVGPEEIVGLLKALEGFLETNHDEVLAEWTNRAENIADTLSESNNLNVRLSAGKDKASGVPKVIGKVKEEAPISAIKLIRTLREEKPRVWIGERRVHLEEFTVSPQQLTDEEADYLVARILAHLG